MSQPSCSRPRRIAALISLLACSPSAFAMSNIANGNDLQARTNEGNFILQGLGVTQDASPTSSSPSDVLTTPTLPNNERVGAAQKTGSPSGSSSRGSSGSLAVATAQTTTTTTSSPTFSTFSTQAPNFTVPATGSGLPYAASCMSELNAYVRYSGFAGTQLPSTTSSYFHYNFTAAYTTLCDGWNRAVGALTPTATITITTSGYAGYTYTGPSPSCTVDSSYCSPLCDAWRTADSSYSILVSATVALPATPTVITIGNPILGTNTSTIATAPITAWPTLSMFGTTYTPSVSSGTPYWTIEWFNAILTPGSTVTARRRPDIKSPPPCNVYEGACDTYFMSEGQRGASPTCPTTDQCVISASRVQLIHFPVTSTVSKNLCDTMDNSNQSVACPGGVRVGPTANFDPTSCSYPPLTTAAEADSGPYAVFSGKTFYENRVYLSIEGLDAHAPCRGRVGTSFQNELLTLHTSDIYSVCHYDMYSSSALPYKFGDLEAPVPVSAYQCQPFCNYLRSQQKGLGLPLEVSYVEAGSSTYTIWPIQGGWCGGILADELIRPFLAVPPQVRALDPLWETCNLDLRGVYDPPIVLTAQATAAQATLGTFLPTTTAAPAPGIATGLAPAKETPTVQAPTPTPTSTQSLPHFTFDPQPDNLFSTPTSSATAPLTISAIIIPQGPQPSGPASTALAAAPASLPSPSPNANGNVGTTGNAPAAGANSNGQSASSVTAFAIGSQTATAGGPAVTAGGTTFSALPSGSGVQVIVGDLTSTFILAAPGATAPSFPSANIQIGSQTLSAGGPAITHSGTTYSALPSGSGVQIAAAGLTTTLPAIAITIAPPSPNTAPQTGANTAPQKPGATTAGATLHPIGPASQSAWIIGGNHVITEGQAWTANGTIFSDVSGTLYTGAAPPATSSTSALASAVKQGAAAAVRIREMSWSVGMAVGVCVVSGFLAVVL